MRYLLLICTDEEAIEAQSAEETTSMLAGYVAFRRGDGPKGRAAQR